ncbi:MAG: antitoxin VapB family protein [Promethearchaeota archaeon]
MTQKTISLPEDVYFSLKRKKQKNETFSDVILRLLEQDKRKKRPDITKFFGMLEEDENGEWDNIEKEIYSERLRPSKRQDFVLEN